MLGIRRKRASTAARRSTIVLAGLVPVLLVALAKLAAPAVFDRGAADWSSTPISGSPPARIGMAACGSSTSTMRASAGSANGPGRAPTSPV